MTGPIRQHHDAFMVAGLKVRTTNRAEGDPATARIGGLWARFSNDGVVGELPQAVLDVWQHIWIYFKAHPEISRRFESDFEAYTNPTDFTVWIGVE
ncbi:MAG: hypothetical protein EOP77_04700 [Variovorax sp.]|nr:MAG: hypothetical protein EOP77_04700 [Variovorax sp.]